MSAVEKFTPQDIISPSQPQSVALTPMDMLNTAITRGAGMDVLERLMALNERWEANQARKAFDAAISAAKAEIRPIVKTAKSHNGFYADIASIAREVDPVLATHGLSYRFRTEQTDKISVTCILSHKDGHSETTTLSAAADSSTGKNSIQAIGSTLTYLQRYTLIQMLGLATAKDDDGHGSGGRTAEFISDEQVAEIRSLIVVTGTDIGKFLSVSRIERIEDMPAKEFARNKGMLERKRQSQVNSGGK